MNKTDSKASRYPSDLLAKFQLRIPHALRDAIEKSAKDHGRSMNTEFTRRLEDSFNNMQEATTRSATSKSLRTVGLSAQLEQIHNDIRDIKRILQSRSERQPSKYRAELQFDASEARKVKTIELLGFSIQEVVANLESQYPAAELISIRMVDISNDA